MNNNEKLAILLCIFGFLLFTSCSSNEQIYEMNGNGMSHGADFDSWWERNHQQYEFAGINKTAFMSFPYSEGIDSGDKIVATKSNYSAVSVGDVVVLQVNGKSRWITRVVHKYEENGSRYLIAKGDGNPVSILNESKVPEDAVLRLVTEKR